MAKAYLPAATTTAVADTAPSINSKIVGSAWQNDLLAQVKGEKKFGFDYKKGRYKDWHLNEDEYYQRVPLTLTSRFQVPFPFMSGFIDTYKSKIDDPFVLKFEDTREAGYRAALKVQAFYDQYSRDEDNDFESIDLDGKFYGLLYGRDIRQVYPEVVNGKFNFCLENVDPYDFYDQGNKGGNLENHEFCGIDFVLRTKYELLDMAKAGYYDMAQVLSLLNTQINKATSVANDTLAAKQNRLIALGLDNKTWVEAGQSKYKLIYSCTTFRGQRFLVTWNEETNIWIRAVPLKPVFNSGLWPFTSWSPKREAHNSWPLGPADDFRPISISMKLFLNQEFDNRNKTNWNMRAFDPEMFEDPADLEWRPEGLVAIKTGSSRTKKIADGIYSFETPQLGGTINMVQYLDQLAGTKLGITNATQGQSSEDKVGIFLGNQQSVADRIEATSKQYRKMQVAIGRRFVWGAYQYLPEPEAVKVIGEQGLGWDKLRKNEINPELKIKIIGGNAQAAMDEIKAKKKSDAMIAIGADPKLTNVVNPNARAEVIMRSAEIPEDQISDLLDMDDYGSKLLLAKAAEALDMLVKGQYPPLCYDANTKFIKKIMNAAFNDKADLKPVVFARFIAFANAHIPIAAKNAARDAALKQAAAGQLQPAQPANPIDTANAAANGLPPPPIQPSKVIPRPSMPAQRPQMPQIAPPGV